MIKLGDFGLATQLDHSNSKRVTESGTIWYVPPESYGGQTELKSDVWALGISLIELAEGRNPYAGFSSLMTMKKVCYGESPSLTSGVWSVGFMDFVNQCLKKNVSERRSVKELMSVSVCVVIDE